MVFADSFTGGQSLTMENGELFFAGWDGDWGLDPSAWIKSWGNGIAPTGAMVVETETMEITSVGPGDDTTVAAIEAGLGL